MKLYNHDIESIELLQRLMQGFFLSYTNQKSIVLTIKSDAALLTSISKGCPLYFELNKKNTEVKLIIEDNSASPFFMIDEYSHPESLLFNKYDDKILKLLQSNEIKLLLYNESNYQIANVDLRMATHFELFIDWTENSEEKFQVNIFTKDFSSEKSIMYIDIQETGIWGGNLINGQSYFKFNDYFNSGKHGYNQEFSVRTFLSYFFTPNDELFYSPKKANNEELTDFLIEYKQAVVLIESKYTISDKQTKFNDAVVKATEQMNISEDIIYGNLDEVADSILRKKLNELKVLIKICLFNDDGRNLKNAFKNLRKNYSPKKLPIFISVSLFKSYLTYNKIKNGADYKFVAINNLLKIISQRGNDIIIFENMDVTNGALTFIEFDEEKVKAKSK